MSNVLESDTPELKERIEKLGEYWARDKWSLPAIQHEFYLEERSAEEGEVMAVAGFDSREEAMKHWLTEYSKYGTWNLHRWDDTAKEWKTAKVQPKGEDIELVWTPYEW